MSRKEKVSFGEKHRLVLACISKKMGVCEAARIARVNHSTVIGWVKRYEAEGADGLLPHTRNVHIQQRSRRKR